MIPVVAHLRTGDSRAAHRGLQGRRGRIWPNRTQSASCEPVSVRCCSPPGAARNRAREATEQTEQRALAERATLLESITTLSMPLDREFSFYLSEPARGSITSMPPGDSAGTGHLGCFSATRGRVPAGVRARVLDIALFLETISLISNRWVRFALIRRRRGWPSIFVT